MSCIDKSVTLDYLESEDPETIDFGCMPSDNGPPTSVPQPDQIPFYFDEKEEVLYYYTCEPEQWTKVDRSVADLNPVDISALGNPEENLNIPVIYEIGGVKVEGHVPLSEIIEIIQSKDEDGNPITEIAYADGELIATHVDGTKSNVDLELPVSLTGLQIEDGNIVVTDSEGNEDTVYLDGIGEITDVRREGDNLVIQQGDRIFRTSIASQPGERPIEFAIDGDKLEITLSDGTILDLTQQEFAEWLASQESLLTTDDELQDLADQIANATDTSNLQNQIDALNNRLNNLPHDQASLSITGGKLVLTNDDGTKSQISLNSLLRTSSDSRNIAEIRNDGLYVPSTSIKAGANVTVVGDGTIAEPYEISSTASGASGGEVSSMSFSNAEITLKQTSGSDVKVSVPVNFVKLAGGEIEGREFIDFPRTSPLPNGMKGLKEEGANWRRAQNTRWWINTGIRVSGRTQYGKYFAKLEQSGLIESPDSPSDEIYGGWWEDVTCRVLSFWNGPQYLYIEVIPRLGPNMSNYTIDSFTWEVYELKEGKNI